MRAGFPAEPGQTSSGSGPEALHEVLEMARQTKKTSSKVERFTNAQASAYQGALEAVLAIPLAAGLGYWADGRLGSSPALLLVGAGVGFAAMVLRLTRMRPETGEEPAAAEAREGEGKTWAGIEVPGLGIDDGNDERDEPDQEVDEQK